MADPLFVLDIGTLGIVATHPQRAELPVLIAPVPEPDKKDHVNTIREHLVAIGCMRLPNTGFAFDSSFVAPESEDAFRRFAKLMMALKNRDTADPKRFPPCSVFAHADPTGNDDYNKSLSGRRALALYGVLTRDVDLWDELFLNSLSGDHWGTKSIQIMLSRLKKAPVNGVAEPFYTGIIDGAKTKETQDLTKKAVAEWRAAHGFTPPGSTLNGSERKVMFREYMDAICHDAKGDKFTLDPKTDFIAKRKDGKGLKGDVQGCGEFNPIFLFSKDKEKLAKDDAVLEQVRNDLYVVDRRALVYIFKHGTEIDPKKWPCPKAREGGFECTKRFWSDGNIRRTPAQSEDRTFGEKMTILKVDNTGGSAALTVVPVAETGNTMACRFYHAFAIHSPCERKIEEWVVRFKIDTIFGRQGFLSNRRYVIKAGEAEFSPVIRGRTGRRGEVRIPVFDENTKMTVKIDAFGTKEPDEDAPPDTPEGDETFDTDPFPDEDTFLQMTLDAGALRPLDVGDDAAVKQRLYNLGFGESAPDKMTPEEFDRAFKIYRRRKNMDNASDEAVRAELFNDHEIRDATVPEPDAEAAAGEES